MKESQQRNPVTASATSEGESAAAVSENQFELRDFTAGDEPRIVQTLTAAFPHGWHSDEFWRWKHPRRPGFEATDVITASVGNDMVACFHGATLPLRLEPGLVVDMSFDGDFAVVPERRSADIPIRAHALTDRRLMEAGVTLRGGFTSKTLNEQFYSRFGYGFVPTSTLHFRKIIGLRPLRQKIEVLGERILGRAAVRRALARRPMTVNVRVETLPEFHVVMTDEAFTVNAGLLDRADMGIESPYAVIMNLTMGTLRFARSLIVNLLSLRLRTRGFVRMSGPLLALAWAFVRKH